MRQGIYWSCQSSKASLTACTHCHTLEMRRTTDLYHRLTFNQDMVDCGWKGPHFWDESLYPARSKRTGYDGSFPAYISIFDKAAKVIEQQPMAVTGEASSNTFTGVRHACNSSCQALASLQRKLLLQMQPQVSTAMPAEACLRLSSVLLAMTIRCHVQVLTYCRGVSWPRRLNVTLAQLLRDANPWTRLIVLMRDPVDRYQSAL